MPNNKRPSDLNGGRESNDASHRQMGQVLVDQGAITSEQLTEALSRQEETGKLLGEICVELWGIDRLALADALTIHWEEIGRDLHASISGSAATNTEADELRTLLAEAETARAQLALKTDELTSRLALLEALVINVSGALEDLRRERH